MQGYQILETIYQSDRVNVSRATRDSDAKSVVIKALNGDFPSIRDVTRIKYEFELLEKAKGTGIVPVLDLQREGNGFILVMEDVGGIPLLDYWSSTPKTLSIFLNLSIQITQILSNLHSRGILHKDIKPANILVQKETGKVYFIDLGLASLLQSEEQAPVQPETLEGTLSYISPEQTGRMNRSIDFRSDLYSLGITFYELLTGRLPFTGTDPLELVHAHIAVSPISPIEIREDIPKSLSDLILKLLSKNAEDRYLTAIGLQGDLEVSRELLLNEKPIAFVPGERESRGIFSIPQKLYGREAEVSFLLDAFERIASSKERVPEEDDTEGFGGTKLILVGGYSGVGKTALINEVHKPILEKRGYFLSGKFDQFKRNIPYYSLIQAFTGLVRQILTEKEEKIQRWKTRILDSCSPNVILLIDLIPELIHITGTQPPVNELPPREAEDRFQKTMQDFVGVFTSHEHPLVIFLDDLQWADLPTLKFLENIVLKNEVQHLLLIGAYRDNEVDALHPFTIMVQTIEKDNIGILKIALAPLMEFFIERMICDTLHREVGSELPELVHQKTGGNPFFVRQLLTTLYRDKHLYYSKESRWEYDLDGILRAGYSENVVEVVANRLKELSGETQEVLKVASCIGASFSLSVLSLAIERDIQKTAKLLKESLMEGVLIPDSSIYRSAETLELIDLIEKKDLLSNTSYRFMHDRVQQASNSLLSQEDNIATHVRIGKILTSSLTENEMEDSIFEVTNHLNYGIRSTNIELNYKLLIELNYRAGKKASLSNAKEPALNYLQIAYTLLKQLDAEGMDIELAFSIEYELGNALYLNGKFQEAEERFLDTINLYAEEDKVFKVQNMRIILYINRGEYERAIELGLESLKMYDIYINSQPTSKFVFSEYLRIKKIVLKYSRDQLLELNLITNKSILNSIQILVNIYSAAYFTNLNLSSILVLNLVEITSNYGNSLYSGFSIVNFASLSSGLGDYNLGYEYGLLALELNERYGNRGIKAKIIHILTGFILHWKIPLLNSLHLHEEGFNIAKEFGDNLYGSFLAWFLSANQDSSGLSLDKIKEIGKKYLYFTENVNYHDVGLGINIILKKTEYLRTNQGLDYNHRFLNDPEIFNKCEKSKMKIHLIYYYFSNAKISYIFNNYNDTVNYCFEARKGDQFILGMQFSSEIQFFQCISKSSLIEVSDPNWKDEVFEKNYKNFKKWFDICPENFSDKYFLIQAEINRIHGNQSEAIKYYNLAIESALQNDFIQNAAIASEMTARYFQKLGIIKLFNIYIQDALHYYHTWGAIAKVKQLEELYSISFNRDRKNINLSTKTSNSITRQTKKNSIDVQSVIKAVQVITKEINLENLLKKLLTITLENAGATRGVLLLFEGESLFLEAVGRIENKQIEVFKDIVIDNYAEIPHSLIQYAIRTSQTIILDSAKDDTQFGENSYIQREKVLSIICMPILTKGKSLGYLYLENNLLKGAFTKDRIETLNLITAQAAISIENAKLYESMEGKVRSRTLELENANISIEKALKKSNDLNDMIQVVIGSNSTDELFNKLSDILSIKYNLRAFVIYIIDKDSNYLSVYKIFGDKTGTEDYINTLYKNKLSISDTNSIHATCVKSKRSFLVRNIRLPHPYKPEEENIIQAEIQSFYIIPLIIDQNSFGTISFSDNKFVSSDLKNLSREDRREIESFIKLISPSIFQSLQKQKIEEANKTAALALKKSNDLNQMIQVIIKSKSSDEVFQRIYDLFSARYDLNSYLVYELDKANENLKLHKIYGSSNKEKPEVIEYIKILEKNKIPILDKYSVHGSCVRTMKSFLMKNIRLPLVHKVDEEEENIIKGEIKSLFIIPLLAEGEVFGTLTFPDSIFEKSNIHNLSRPDREEIESFIKLISPSIYQSIQKQKVEESLSQLQKTKTELETEKSQMERIQFMSQQIQKKTNFQEILYSLEEIIWNTYKISDYILAIKDTEAQEYRSFSLCKHWKKYSLNEKLRNVSMDETDSIYHFIFTKNKTVYLPKLKTISTGKSEDHNRMLLGMESIFAIPCIINNETFAALSFSDIRPEYSGDPSIRGVKNLNSKQRKEIEQLVALIANSLYQSLQKKELENQKKSIEELNKFIKNLNESHEFDIILEKTKSYIKNYFNIDHYAIGLTNLDKRYVKFLDTSLTTSIEQREVLRSFSIPIVDTLGAHAFAYKSNKPLYIKNIKSNRITIEEKQIIDLFQFKSILIIPLVLNGIIIGFLDLSNKDKELSLTKEQINQLSILAEQLAGIIYSSNLYQELQTQKLHLESTLTELRTTQAQLVEAEKSAALGQLISGVAHEINNPLAAIRSSAEILEMDQSRILEDFPKFFQSASPTTLSLFLELQTQSSKNKKYLPSREERQRKKNIRSTFETIPFESSTIKEETVELVSELFLEDSYPKLKERFTETEALQILQMLSLFSTQKNALKNIRLSTEKSARVIFSLRKFLGTDIKGTPREIRISDLIESSLRTYGNYIQGIVQVEKDFSGDSEIVCVVDEIQQVLKNLIFNSIQSMYTSPMKKLRIVVKKVNTESGEKRKISIEDSGTGVGEDVVQNLFTPFFSTKSRGEGIGLGLYVSKKIVEEHGGRLEYEALEGGSRFVVWV